MVIQGARQVGKSTLAGILAERRPSVTVTLDDEQTRLFAREDPITFLQQPGTACWSSTRHSAYPASSFP